MASSDRIAIFPSRANKVVIKLRELSARRGIGLLRRKRDAIDIKLRELNRFMLSKEDEVDEAMRAAIFSVTKANLIGTDFKPLIVANNDDCASATIRKRQQKVVGVPLDYFVLELNPKGAYPMTGLCCGGAQVQTVRELFQVALSRLVDLASLELMVRMLSAASHQTNMRVNALEHVVIPRLKNTYDYICAELEEFEREDFYRLKRSQAKQLEAKLAFSELIRTKNMNKDELNAYLKRTTSVNVDINFNSEDFEEENVEERKLRARLERHLARKAQREARGEALVRMGSSFIRTKSMSKFMDQQGMNESE